MLREECCLPDYGQGPRRYKAASLMFMSLKEGSLSHSAKEKQTNKLFSCGACFCFVLFHFFRSRSA